MNIFSKIFARKKDLKFSYEEHKYSLSVKILIGILTLIVLGFSQQAMNDLTRDIPKVDYPRTWNLESVQKANDYHRNNLQNLKKKKGELETQISILEEKGGEDSLFQIGDMEELQKELDAVNAVIEKNSVEYDRLRAIADEKEDEILKTYRWSKILRQLRVFGWEVLFWLPFFLVSLYWHERMKKRGSKWEVVSLAAYIASGILALESLGILLWSCLPRQLLERLWEILQVTIFTRIVGYYLFIAIIILVLGAFVVYVHNRSQDPVRGGKRKIRNGLCPQCSYPLNLCNIYCGGCGRELKKKCSSCDAYMYTWDAVCTTCGK